MIDVLNWAKSLSDAVPAIREPRIWRAEKKRFMDEARERFTLEKPEHGHLSDYRNALYRHRVTYSEYMYSYEFWRLDESARSEFLSNSEVQCVYRALGSARVRNIFRNKPQFLTAFAPFVNRRWALATNLSKKEFERMISGAGCIAKPVDGSQGAGILKLRTEGGNDVSAVYRKCLSERLLLEECVTSCEEMAVFHPVSLNTLRVVTISEKDRFEVFGAIFRMGTGNSVIDNTHAGGIYAPINVASGRIEVPAIDARNNRYERHPDTDVPIVGFQVPAWKEVLEVCRQATRQIPGIRFAGWDLAVCADGRVELIEGNHAPDFDGGMQAPLKIGVKKRFQETVQRVIGTDPLKRIHYYHKKS